MRWPIIPSILLLQFVLPYVALAQPPDTLWTRTYGHDGDEIAYAIQNTTDGGFVLAGATTTGTAGDWIST